MSKAVFLTLFLAAAGLFFWRASRHRQEIGLSSQLPPIISTHRARPAALAQHGTPGPGARPAAGKAEDVSPLNPVGAARQAASSSGPAADTPTGKLALLEEVLRSRNDNDPRLDTAFNDLSPQTKCLFRQKYRQLPPESRNELGTVVYLLGRNLKTEEDWAFLHEVVIAQPCLSPENCSRRAKTEPDPHATIGTEITLSYPAIMALKRAEKILQSGRGDSTQALQLISAAESSASRTVADLAASIEQRYSRR